MPRYRASLDRGTPFSARPFGLGAKGGLCRAPSAGALVLLPPGRAPEGAEGSCSRALFSGTRRSRRAGKEGFCGARLVGPCSCATCRPFWPSVPERLVLESAPRPPGRTKFPVLGLPVLLAAPRLGDRGEEGRGGVTARGYSQASYSLRRVFDCTRRFSWTRGRKRPCSLHFSSQVPLELFRDFVPRWNPTFAAEHGVLVLILLFELT